MHEHSIFKRHVLNLLSLFGPSVTYACLRYQEISAIIKIPTAVFLGIIGAKVVSEILCEAYKLINWVAGAFQETTMRMGIGTS